MDFLNIFNEAIIPVGSWVEQALQWLVQNFRWFFQAIKAPFDVVLSNLEGALVGMPQLIMLAIITLVAWQFAGRRIGIISFACMLAVGLMGAWKESMTTLSIVITCVVFCALIGIPLGVVAARNDRFWAVLQPLLDLMQTIPSFVYLVPVVMLFSIGNVAGVIVTFIYALPPVVRLTNLGIRQVRHDMVEAAQAFGASPRQTLYKVQIPLAMPTIMAGVNQTIMMALSMVVVSSMISVTGLGQMVLRGIGRLDMGLATIGGLGIVLLAIVIDRVSQSFGASARTRGHLKWHETGPLGYLRGLMKPTPSTQSKTAAE